MSICERPANASVVRCYMKTKSFHKTVLTSSSSKFQEGAEWGPGVNRRKDEGTPFLLFSLPTHENKTAKQSTQADNSVSLTSKFYIRLLYEDRKGFFVQCSAVSGSEQS
jgi:hypothetical protein